MDRVGHLIDPLELLVTIPFRAVATGTATFTGDPADQVPPNETTLFGDSTFVGSGADGIRF